MKLARARSKESGGIPTNSITIPRIGVSELRTLSNTAEEHYTALRKAGFPGGRQFFGTIAGHLKEEVNLLDFRTIQEDRGIFQIVPAELINEDGSLIIKDEYTFLRWDGSFFCKTPSGFGPAKDRYIVKRRVVQYFESGLIKTKEEGQAIGDAYKNFIRLNGWKAKAILLKQISSAGKTTGAVVHVCQNGRFLYSHNNKE